MKEQLKLIKQEPIPIKKVLWKFIDEMGHLGHNFAKLYKDLLKTSGLILPSWSRIRRFVSFTKFRGNIDLLNYKYFEMRCSKLTPKDRNQYMAIVEVYPTQALELSGGIFLRDMWPTNKDHDNMSSCKRCCWSVSRHGGHGTDCSCQWREDHWIDWRSNCPRALWVGQL